MSTDTDFKFFADLIKSREHKGIKNMLISEIEKHEKYFSETKNINDNKKFNPNNDVMIMAVFFNGRIDKTNYFCFTNKYDLIKKIIYYMYDDVKNILYYDWNNNLSPIDNLDYLLLENDPATVCLELLNVK